jgi:hypothetical protein
MHNIPRRCRHSSVKKRYRQRHSNKLEAKAQLTVGSTGTVKYKPRDTGIVLINQRAA